MQVRVKTRAEYSYTTSRSMEVPGPGLFSKASRPLEASIKIYPTVVLTNSLPYHIEGYLISWLGGTAKDPDATNLVAAAGHVPAKPPVVPDHTVGSVPTGILRPTGMPFSATESRRVMTRGDAQQDQDRVITHFERTVLPLLSSKARQLWEAHVSNYTYLPVL
jgi:hypothetical protein